MGALDTLPSVITQAQSIKNRELFDRAFPAHWDGADAIFEEAAALKSFGLEQCALQDLAVDGVAAFAHGVVFVRQVDSFSAKSAAHVDHHLFIGLENFLH